MSKGSGRRRVAQAAGVVLLLQQSVQPLARRAWFVLIGRPWAAGRVLQRTWGRAPSCCSRALLGDRHVLGGRMWWLRVVVVVVVVGVLLQQMRVLLVVVALTLVLLGG